MSPVLWGVLGYVLLQFAIGIYVSRRIRTEDDYLVGGRSLGYGLATFTTFATWFGAETCIGAAGAIYAFGLAGASADPFGYGICLLFMALVFAVPLWRLQLTTVADLFRRRYDVAVERVVVLLMVPTSLLWGAAQIRAFGQVLAASSGMALSITVSIAALVVVLYTVFGGLLADAWTDLIQGTTLLIGLSVLAVAAWRNLGPEVWAAIDPARLRPFGGEGVPTLAVLEEWAIPVCGSVLAAELVSRVLAARSARVAQRSVLMASGLYLAFGLIPAALGLLGAVVLPGLADPEQVLPLMAQRLLPTGLYVVFTGALISAIISTVDSALLVSSSLLSHNLVVPLLPRVTEAQKVRIARTGVAVLGVVAYGMALHAEGVYSLVEEASAFGSAGIFVVALFGLFTRFGGSASALAALLTGVVAWIAGEHLLGIPYPYLASLAGAALAYLAAAPLGGGVRRAWHPEFDGARRGAPLLKAARPVT
jgi:Na+/proline symporter